METTLSQEGFSFGSTELMIVLILSLIALLVIVVVYYRNRLRKAKKVIIRLMREKASLDQVGYKLLPMLAMVLSLTACSNTDHLPTEGDANRTALSINAGISAIAPNVPEAASRAENTQWQPGDAIGIIMLTTGTNTPTDAQTNHRYYTTDGTGTFVPDGGENIAYFPTGGALVDLIAYYPHTATLATTGTDAFVLPIDVADQTDLPAIDLMTAPRITDHSSAQPDVALTFSHRLCKLMLHVAADETTADINLAGATAAITGMPATAQWDIMAEALQPSITQEVSTIALPMTADGTRATAILIPTDAAAGRTIAITTADGKKFTATLASNLAFQAGTVNTYTITLHRTNATISGVSILPWTEGTNISTDATLDDITTGGTISLPAATSGTFHLAAIEENKRIVAVYDWDGTALAPGFTDPLAWNALKKEPHTFHATFNPATAAATGHEKDYLTATTPNLPFGALLNFPQMAHANAQLSVVVTSTDGTLSATQLATTIAKVKITQTSACGTNGIISFAQADDVVTLMTAAAAPTAPVTRTAILAPQTLSGIALTIDGKPYTISDAVQLEPGIHTTVTANIKASAVSINIAVADWKDKDLDSGDIEIDK